MRYVCEDSILFCRRKRVEVGFLVCSGGDSEEAVFGVDGVQTSVFADSHPGNIVTDSPNLIALVAQVFRRNHHCKVGLAAGRRECSRNVLNLTLGILDSENKHMLSHPALFPALVRCNAQGKALLAQKHVAAVAGVYGNDGIVLGELADISLFGVDVAS